MADTPTLPFEIWTLIHSHLTPEQSKAFSQVSRTFHSIYWRRRGELRVLRIKHVELETHLKWFGLESCIKSLRCPSPLCHGSLSTFSLLTALSVSNADRYLMVEETLSTSLTNLVTLEISGGKFSFPPSLRSRLTSLQLIWPREDINSLSTLFSLESLTLLGTDTFHGLSALSRLTSLSITSNEIDHLDFLSCLSTLRSLTLKGASLPAMRSISTLSFLTNLEARTSGDVDLHPPCRLRRLVLSSARLSLLEGGDVSLPGLESLDISSQSAAPLTDQQLLSLSLFTCLRTLLLENRNSFTGTALSRLAHHLPSLKFVSLRYTALTPSGGVSFHRIATLLLPSGSVFCPK